VDGDGAVAAGLKTLPAELAALVRVTANWQSSGPLAGALVEGDAARLLAANRRIAELPGPIVLTQGVPAGGEGVEIAWLMNERSLSTNTTAAGGNASLVAMS